MTCEQCNDQLSRWLDGDLSPQMAQEVQTHIEACPECAETAEILRQALKEAGAMGEGLPVPEGASRAWREAIAEQAAGAFAKTPLRQRPWARFASVAALVILLVGVTILTNNEEEAPYTETAVMSVYSQTPTPALYEAAGDDAYSYGAQVEYESPAEASEPLMLSKSASRSGGSALDEGDGEALRAGGDGKAPELSPEGTMLQRTANYSISTLQFDTDAQKLMEIPLERGGWIAQQSLTGTTYVEGGNDRRLSLTLRIPAENTDGAMADLEDIGILQASSVYAVDVSEQYYDTQGRLESAQALQKQLQDLLSRADTVELLVEITKELNQNQWEIDSLQGSLRGMESRVSYSTLQVDLSETRTPTLVTPTTETLGGRMRDRFVRTGNRMISFFGDLAVGFVGALPWLLPVLILLGFATWILRRHYRK